MNLITLSWRYVWSKPLSAALNVLMLSLGLGAFAFILLAEQRVTQALERDVAGIDLVVGAKGSPMQLILSGVFHIDTPSGNILLADVQALEKHQAVAQMKAAAQKDLNDGFNG